MSKLAWLNAENAVAFEDRGVVEAYRYRASHPPETIDILRGLTAGGAHKVLDTGAGTARITIRLLASADPSSIDQARRRG